MGKLNVHWLLYPILCAALVGALWLWQDTQAKEIDSLKAQVASAKQAQQQVIEQAQTAVDTALKAQAAKTKVLTKTLNQATTPQAQVDIINKGNDTHLGLKPQASNPSDGTVTIEAPKPDLFTLAKQSIALEECNNQVAVDKVQKAADDSKLDAADTRIKAQDAEITSLNGGSHFRRFLKATKWWVIGVGSGVVIDFAVRK